MRRINTVSSDEELILDEQKIPLIFPEPSILGSTEQVNTPERYLATASQSTDRRFLYILTLSNIFIRVIECFTIESFVGVKNKPNPNQLTQNILHLLHASMFTFSTNNGFIALSDFYSYLSFCRAVMATVNCHPISSMVLYKNHQGSRYRFDYQYKDTGAYPKPITLQSETYATVHQLKFSDSWRLLERKRTVLCMMFSLLKNPGELHHGDEIQPRNRYFYDRNNNQFKLMFKENNLGYLEINTFTILVEEKYCAHDASHTPFLIVLNSLKSRYELVSLADYFYTYFKIEVQPSSEYLFNDQILTYIAYSPRRVLFHESGLTFVEALFNAQSTDWKNKIDVFNKYIQQRIRSTYLNECCHWAPLFVSLIVISVVLLAIPFHGVASSNTYINAGFTSLKIASLTCSLSLFFLLRGRFHNSYTLTQEGNWLEKISLDEGPQKICDEKAEPPKFSSLFLRCRLWNNLNRPRDAPITQDRDHFSITIP
jgi:hypothetical protein